MSNQNEMQVDSEVANPSDYVNADDVQTIPLPEKFIENLHATTNVTQSITANIASLNQSLEL